MSLVHEICADSLTFMRASAQPRIVIEVRIRIFQEFERGNLRQARAVLDVGAHADRQTTGARACTDRADRNCPVRVRNLLQHFTALSSLAVAAR